MKRFPAATLLGLLLATTVACEKRAVPVATGAASADWFPPVQVETLRNKPGVSFIPAVQAYQQTTEYTCGPAALLALARFHGVPGITPDRRTEMRIAREAGTRSLDVLQKGGKPGTRPEEMVAWFKRYGLQAKLEYEEKGDGSALETLRQYLRRGVPVLVEWADLTGHWVIAVGYDDRGDTDPANDVLIFADSYDKYDDHADGYTFVNANRFYWLWFDAFYFDRLTWRTMITVSRPWP